MLSAGRECIQCVRRVSYLNVGKSAGFKCCQQGESVYNVSEEFLT